jgi:hypothetical protein
MDIKNFKSLMEAYSEVYAPEQIDEVLDTPEKANEYAKKNVKSMVGAFVKGAVNKDISQLKTIEKRKRGAELAKRKAERKVAEEQNEEFDIFDVVLEFLQVEGYAETLEEAEWIMANELDAEDIEEILEAEGSYGQTPKARTAMGKLEVSRRTKPVGEYSQRGEKTRKVKAAEKHNRRMDNGPDVGNRGKKSTSPRYSFKGGRGKMDQDSRDWSRERDVEYSAGENKHGEGSVTKNPKKLRKQKAMGEHD